MDPTILEVAITPPRFDRLRRGDAELAGLVTALAEHNLSELANVVPWVRGATISPGLARTVTRQRELWRLSFDLRGKARDLELRMDLCDPAGSCRAAEARGPRDSAPAAVAALLGAVAHATGRVVITGTSTTWSSPESADPYAVLLAGRAAATWYGLLPPVPPEARGDRRKDPVERAIAVDPRMPIASWISGRRALADHKPRTAYVAFTRAASLRPNSVPFHADRAAALDLTGDRDAALDAWDQVLERSPCDLRFGVAHARAALEAQDPDRAARILDSLPDRFDEDAAVVEVRVAIDAVTGGLAAEVLLERWQRVAPLDPEPVRRRISARIGRGALAEARSLVPELRARGAAAEARGLEVSLAIAARDYAAARLAMREGGMDESLRRLDARAALERNPAALVPGLAAATDPVAIVARGGAKLARGQAEEALAEAHRAREVEPWMPEALALERDALARLGRIPEATEADLALHAADPAWPATATITAAGVISTSTSPPPRG